MRIAKKLNIPFYAQSTSFTCDPACLMMALKYFNPNVRLSQELEFDIWRESYGIGVPGCMPQGLAYSALIRKLNATIICRRSTVNKTSGKIAKGENKRIAESTSKELFKKAASKGMELINKETDVEDIEVALGKGQIPLIMVNMKLLHNIDSPHWIVATGFDNNHVWINDPYNKKGKDVRISKKNLECMMADLKKHSGLDQRILILSKRA